jgi:hypothetical protein
MMPKMVKNIALSVKDSLPKRRLRIWSFAEARCVHIRVSTAGV